jgi:ribosomal protein L11 methyltransferase
VSREPLRKIELRLHSQWPEFAEEALFAQGADAVRQEDEADDPVLEPAPGETPLWGHTITCGYFSEDADLDSIESVLRELLPDGAELRIERRILIESDWMDAWKQYAKPLPFGGGRLWIWPSHIPIDDSKGVIVNLDAGLAFGTGTHASTALCLEWLATQDLHGKRVLDYGCGSGILAIAALKLGAASAIGVDIDPQALIATRANAEINGVGARIACASVEQFVDETVDIVVANILALPLVGLSAKLAGWRHRSCGFAGTSGRRSAHGLCPLVRFRCGCRHRRLVETQRKTLPLKLTSVCDESRAFIAASKPVLSAPPDKGAAP